ncbi:hypothetical protein KJ359_007134 [Pestalotiopsis sp. 9143b]|nr:hypothetical protein KJ359_007134 [Pestalotiopsis sp. 9143b]
MVNIPDEGPRAKLTDILPCDVNAMTSYPDLSACGKYDGKGAACRWLLRLRYEFKRAGQRVPEPSKYLEA